MSPQRPRPRPESAGIPGSAGRLPAVIGARAACLGLILGALLLAGCGGASRPAHRAASALGRGRTVPPVSSGPAPAIRRVGARLPVGPVRALLRHIPAGTSAVTIIDLHAARAVLSLPSTANPFAPGPGESAAETRLLAALTRLDLDAPALVPGIDFTRVTALVRFRAGSGEELLLRVAAPPRAIVRRLLRHGWRLRRGAYRRRAPGDIFAVPFRGGVAIGRGRRATLAVAAQRAIVPAERPLLTLLPANLAPAVSVAVPGPASCVTGIVAIEQLVPHDASVSVFVRGAPQLSRLRIAPGSGELRRIGLRAQPPSVAGHMINVPVLPVRRPAASIISALRSAVAYRCGG